MSLYYTTSQELTSVADAIRTASGTSASLVYPSGFISTIAGLGKLVTGTFTTSSSLNTVGDVTINYSGSGYPIACLVYGSIGVNISGWSARNIELWLMLKRSPAETPTYSGSSIENRGDIVTLLYSSASATTPKSTYSNYAFSTDAPTLGADGSTACRFKNATTLSYKTLAASGSYFGFKQNTEYKYIVLYSE